MRKIFNLLAIIMLFYSIWNFLQLDFREALWSFLLATFCFYEVHQEELKDTLHSRVKKKEALLRTLQKQNKK